MNAKRSRGRYPGTCLILLALAPLASGAIIYVDDSAVAGGNTGRSWTDAFTNLARALDQADTDDEIRVAQGKYKPASWNGDRAQPFRLRRGKIRGGYAGLQEPNNPDARDIGAYETVLSGDLNNNDESDPTKSENSYHVVNGSETDDATELDGFTITGGNANGVSLDCKNGGGMYNDGARLTVMNCHFCDNLSGPNGGAMFNKAGAPKLMGCRFSRNRATNDGGAIYNLDSRPVLIHCTFSNNQAANGGGIYNTNSHTELIGCAFYSNTTGSGGGVYNHLSDPNLTNCLFSGNAAKLGGGLFNFRSYPHLTNCTFSRNSAAGSGGGLYNVSAAPTLTNCVLWGNSDATGTGDEAQIAGGTPAVSHCCIQGGISRWPGQENILADPLFADDDGRDGKAGTEDDDLRLLRISPCIDTGDSNALPPDADDLDTDENVAEPIPFDYADNPRISNEAVDRGAFEFCEALPPARVGPVLYVDARAQGSCDGRSWATALISLQEALRIAREYRVVREIRVAAAVYTPAEPNRSRTATFQLVSNVAIRGGYAGGGRPDPHVPSVSVDPNTRDIGTYETILSGDLNGNDAAVADPCNLPTEITRSDNCYHVVTGSGADANAVLDGFTIRAGVGSGTYDEHGGGAYIMTGSPTIIQCTFQGNAAMGNGGAIYCLFSDPTIRACTIRGNYAGRGGGGIYCDTSSPLIQNNSIADNRGTAEGRGAGIACDKQSAPVIEHNTIRGNRTPAEGGGICCLNKSGPRIVRNTIIDNASREGGGIYCDDADPNILDNLIIANTAADDGGGISAINDAASPNSHPTIRNNTIVRNQAHPQGGGIFCEASLVKIVNCILWDNGDDFHNWTPENDCNPMYSCIQDGDAGAGNIAFYPHFVDPQNGDYRLKPYSPCIDAGQPGLELLVLGETDLDGGPRVNFLLVDMGADETDSWKRTSDTDHDGLPDAWEREHFDGLQFQAEDDPDGDTFSNLDEYHEGAHPDVAQRDVLYVSSANGSDPRADGSPEHPFASIQKAIDEAVERGRILVTEGIFHERLTIDSKVLSLEGGYSPDFTSVAHATTLSADGKGRAVLYLNVPGGLLTGFIITDGRERDGGGMYLFNSSPTIQDNIITGNNATDDGGGVSFYYRCQGLFVDNIVMANCSADNAGGIYCRASSPRIHNCVITGNEATKGNGGAIRVRGDAQPWITGCTITGNRATEAGAIICREPRKGEMVPPALTIVNCTISDNDANSLTGGKGGLVLREATHATIKDSIISGNTAPGLWADRKSTVQIEGVVETRYADWEMKGASIIGEGELHTGPGAVLWMDNCSLQCTLTGQGTIEVKPESELRIEGQARVDFATDPEREGAIWCEGLLYVRDNAQITGAQINVTRASFEGDVDITNSVIHAEAGAPYGQFFVADTVKIAGSDIHADGDRYMDLDPTVFTGLIEKNRIYVRITEGVGHTRGGLFELRGLDLYRSPQDPPGQFLFPHPQVPDFSTVTWTIEELTLDPGARLNLTNRFDFQALFDQGGENEVLYVRNLVLGPNSVLNAAFNRVYYENLSADPCAVIESVPLLGFSLNNIAFDDDNEFLTRVRHNNVVDPSKLRLYVQRVPGKKADPNDGVMRMCNLEDTDEKSPTFGAVHARAKGLFAKSNERAIQIRFEYLFGDPAGSGELVVYLSDCPELLDPQDPNRDLHYLEVARLSQPPAGRPGSAESGEWGVFERVVSVGHLNFIRGTRIELEFVGPANTCVFIDNWDPAVRCVSYCGDIVGGNHNVDEFDFLAALGECGRRIDEVVTSGGLDAWCLDGFFCADGYVTVHDALAVEWIVKKKRNLCPDEHNLDAADVRRAAYSDASVPAPPVQKMIIFPANEPALDIRGQFLVTAKRADAFLSDQLYGLDSSGHLVSGPLELAPERCNGRLVRDPAGHLYQLDLELGLVRLADGAVLVNPGRLSVEREPRSGGPATVYVGLPGREWAAWRRPLLDAAFDAQGCLYVVPVVVAAPELDELYVATARLKLDETGQERSYRVEQLLDDPPMARDNLDPNQLREVEVDRSDNVYVLNCDALNRGDVLWVYSSDGQLAARRDLQEFGIRAPIGLCVSSYDPSRLYLSSSENRPDANSVRVYVLSTTTLSLLQAIEIHNMGHVTDIAEDPASGTVCVVGFQIPIIPPLSQVQDADIWSQPRLAIIPLGDAGPVEAVCPVAPTANDMVLPLSVISAEGTVQSHGGAP